VLKLIVSLSHNLENSRNLFSIIFLLINFRILISSFKYPTRKETPFKTEQEEFMKKSLSLLLLFLSSVAIASPGAQTFTYEGKVLNTAGTAPLTSVISLNLSIYDPSAVCLLYQEQQANIDLSQTNGIFAVQVGSLVGATKRTGLDPGLNSAAIYANNGLIRASGSTNCTAGYTPAAGDGRLLRVAVTNGGSTVTISPDLQINSVPNSFSSETLQGKTPSQLTPPGTVINFAGATCPSGFLAADGSSQLISAYSNLASALNVGTNLYAWGSADTTHFNLPDLRGVFVRGMDSFGTPAGAANRDPDKASRTAIATGGNSGATVGSYQPDQIVSHTHAIISPPAINFYGGSGGTGFTNGGSFSGPNATPSIANTGGNETRGKNVYVNFCVKY
jgi:hypothetical protein